VSVPRIAADPSRQAPIKDASDPGRSDGNRNRRHKRSRPVPSLRLERQIERVERRTSQKDEHRNTRQTGERLERHKQRRSEPMQQQGH